MKLGEKIQSIESVALLHVVFTTLDSRRFLLRKIAAPKAAIKISNFFTTHHPCQEPIGSVGVPGLEPGTSSLSAKRSNRLSYTPFLALIGPR